jgi:hypothetical protein
MPMVQMESAIQVVRAASLPDFLFAMIVCAVIDGAGLFE